MAKKALGPWTGKSWDVLRTNVIRAATTRKNFEKHREAFGSDLTAAEERRFSKMPNWVRGRPDMPLTRDDLQWIRNPAAWYREHGGLKSIKTLAQMHGREMQWMLNELVLGKPAGFSAIEIGGGQFPIISRLGFKKKCFIDVSQENLAATKKATRKSRRPVRFILQDIKEPLQIGRKEYSVCVMNEVLTHIGLKRQNAVLRQLIDKGITRFFISDRSTRGTYPANVDFIQIAVFLKRSGFNALVHSHSAYSFGHFFIQAEKTSGTPKIQVESY